MKKVHLVLLAILLLTASLPILAQHQEELPKVEVFGGYSLLRSDGHNFNGWKTAVGFTLNRWAAIAVDGSGYYYSESTPHGKLRENEYSLTVGPHLSLRNKSKLVPFAYAMAGGAWENSSLGPESESGSGFAFETGGGVDWEISKAVSIRLIDVGASVTHIHGTTFNKPKFTTGIVFMFGHK